MEESVAIYSKVDEPYEYVKMTPKLFSLWNSWARTYKPSENGSIRPFESEKQGPDFMRGDFPDLNSFYEFYVSLLESKEE